MSVLGLILAVLGLLVAAVVLIFIWAIRALITQEATALVPAASRDLLRRAVNRLPAEQRLRWEEEWPAEFHETIERRPLLALREALSLYRSAVAISRELEPEPAAVSVRGRTELLGSALGERAGRLAGFFSAFNRSFEKRLEADLDRVLASLIRLTGISSKNGARLIAVTLVIASMTLLVSMGAAALQPLGSLIDRL